MRLSSCQQRSPRRSHRHSPSTLSAADLRRLLSCATSLNDKTMPAATPRGDSPPRQLPAVDTEAHGDDVLVEEETLSWFDPQRWYPVRIGDVINSKYQVLVKLGFGSVSTVWLCRDLQEHDYMTLKVYETGHRQAANENTVLQHLRPLLMRDKSNKFVRSFRDSFEISGPVGPHACLIHEPLCLSLEDLRLMANGRLDPSLLKPLIHGVLRGLDYLHRRANIVHTDLQAGNIMLSTEEPQVWVDLVKEEWADPSPRKVAPDRVIYVSRIPDIPEDGRPVICDFGEARVGAGPFTGEVMPDLYRVPEIILYIPWAEKIDIWSTGLLTWDLLEGKHLFNRRLPSRQASRGAHIARIVALLGNPPEDFLHRSKEFSEFFGDNGTLKSNHEVEQSTSLEAELETLKGQEKIMFLTFLRRMLQWRPEDRASAEELLGDPWLRENIDGL
ncbi:serine/threonine-protein kinase SRPK3 [Microdochium nivale]|nr:serine/threonine-protein kinase SRPK3 [Microdochium nivale]